MLPTPYDDLRSGIMLMPVGWTVYYLRDGFPHPLSERIKTVFADEKGAVYYTENFWFTAECLGETVFFTEREAKARVSQKDEKRQAETLYS